MYRRIVVAYNAGNEGRDALALADRLARPEHARVVVVQAMPRATGRTAARETQTRIAAARASMNGLLAPELQAEYRPLLARAFAPSVHAVAADLRADLIVAGQGRLGPIARGYLGGGAELLVDGARCPVAVAAPDQAQRPPLAVRCVAVGFDASPAATLAAIAATHLARGLDASLRIVTVDGSARAARIAAGRLARSVPVEVVALAGDPARALLGQAEAGADAIVVGRRDRRPAQRPGVSARVMGNAGCPVWVVPSTAAGAVPVADVATAA